MIFTALLFVLCLCSHSTVSMPLYSDASILRIPYRSQALRPFVESQRRTKFVRSIDEYESERRREKSRAELEGLTDIVAESIKQQAEEAQRAIKGYGHADQQKDPQQTAPGPQQLQRRQEPYLQARISHKRICRVSHSIRAHRLPPKCGTEGLSRLLWGIVVTVESFHVCGAGAVTVSS
ncbi:hypothetical protein QR680_012974 [Steinernema hermaphroditum]|uniref:SXP/RAL-2 family protein Ani s 5-like cation-binding domain-containing protein n=1 Tax=Steinernema hermaphroditum TaxID=289476 RepID=A0AA39M1I9_9BILA|nr:hypothetical protein QR680_012974 [Steinernema hermaphroditum]